MNHATGLVSFFKKTFFKKPGAGKRVFVGVSGGVDSSVSAALLKDQGYDVVGVFIRTWTPEWLPCTWRDERRDAMRVCAHLQIPFVELDLEKEYKQGVADYMIAEYRAGRTPNPDVMCNKEVKFGGFLNWARTQGAHAIATGHYAQQKDGKLFKGNDPAKDQSYFLWTLTASQLEHTLFPIGHLPKHEVRKLAAKYHLPTALKKDSQGICFIGMVDMKEFLKHYIHVEPGKILNEEGIVIGHHEGVILYTLGERHGFTITHKGTQDKPYYVIEKDIQNNTLTVSQNNILHKASARKVYHVQDIVFREPPSQKGLVAQIRYHGEFLPCSVTYEGDRGTVTFSEGRNDIALGQSVVFYQDTQCLGGAIVIDY